MRVFVTGATGYIGGRVVRELLGAGHEVTGLVRSAGKAAPLAEAGMRVVVGEMAEPAGYRAAAAGHDAFILLAAGSGPGRIAADRVATTALLDAAKADKRHAVLLYTSGIWVLGETGDVPAAEDAPTDHPAAVVAWKPIHEETTLAAATPRLATAVVRLGMVWGGRGGNFEPFFRTAVDDGATAFVGPGTNRWCPVHVDDVARFYRMAVEERARGIFHLVDGSAIPVATLAAAASRAAGAGGRTRSIPVDVARQTLGRLAPALTIDQVVIGPRAIELGWLPTRGTFVERAPEAFREWQR